jgi:uncharacterized protein (TIGR00251 family)
MRLTIKVVPNAKENRVVEQNGSLTVRTTESPVRGRANAAALDLLEAYFGKPVHLVAGATSRKKIVEVLDTD